MLVVSIMPNYVIAASKITLKSGAAAPASVYAGHSYTLKVAGTTVKFTSSNKKVATIGLTTGKMKAVAPGTVKITAKSKKTGKTVATKSFKVLQRATAVAADVTELYLGAVGDTATLKATKTPATSTDVVKFFTADKTIATVGMTSGKVTAKAEGKTTISVYSLATKATAKSSKNNKVATVDVYVGPYMASATQGSTTDISVTFKSDMKDVKVADFTIINDVTKVTYPVKTATISKTDAKVVELTTYSAIKDAGNYTVSYGKTSAKFTATDGNVAGISITPSSVNIGTETPIYVVTKDANGVVLDKYTKENLPSNIDLSIEVSGDDYATDKGALCLQTKTSKATAKAKFHTNKFSKSGDEEVYEDEESITAYVPEAASYEPSYTIAKSAPNFASTSYKQNTAICVGDTGYSAYFKIVDSSNNEIQDYSLFNVTSSDENVLLVTSELQAATNHVGIAPIKAGSAYLVVKNSTTGEFVASLPVTVRAEGAATSLVLDKSSVTLSNSPYLNGDRHEVALKVLDQYGQISTGANEALNITVKSKPTDFNADTAASAVHSYVSNGIGAVSVDATGLMAGNYVYEVKYGTLQYKTLSVAVKDSTADGSVSFELCTGADTMDAVISNSDDSNKSISVDPVLTTKGVTRYKLAVGNNELSSGICGTYSAVEVTIIVKNSAGKDVTSEYLSEDGRSFLVTREIVDGVVEQTPADTYTIYCTFTATELGESSDPSASPSPSPTPTPDPKQVTLTRTQTIKVTNTMATVTFTRVSNTYADSFAILEGALSNTDDVLNNCYTFYYDGTAYGKNGTPIANASAECSYVSENAVAFKKVYLPIKISDGTIVKVPVDVTSAAMITKG